MCDPQAPDFISVHRKEIDEAIKIYRAGIQLSDDQVELLSNAFPDYVMPWEQARLCNDKVFRWFMRSHPDLCDATVNRICSRLPFKYRELRSAFSHQEDKTLTLGAGHRSVRCDIFIAAHQDDKPDGAAGRYIDLEHQNRNEHDVMQRALTINCLMFGSSLPENSNRTDIPGVMTIFICNFKPPKEVNSWYRVATMNSDLAGRETGLDFTAAIIYTKGQGIPEELSELLDLLRTGDEKSGEDQFVNGIKNAMIEERMVRSQSSTLEGRYFMSDVLTPYERYLATAEGRAKGIAEGRAEGKHESRLADIKALLASPRFNNLNEIFDTLKLSEADRVRYSSQLNAEQAVKAN